MRVYLDDVLIDEPEGSSGMYTQRNRSARYWGLLNTGRVLGIGQMEIKEPLAIQILSSEFEKNLIDGKTIFKITDDSGASLVRSEVDFANFRELAEGWSITLRDEGNVENLEYQSDTIVEIATTRTEMLEPVRLAQDITHTIDPALSRVAWKSIAAAAKSPAHFPAWKADSTRASSTGDPSTVTDVFQEQAVWKNTTGGERRVQLTARIAVSHRSEVETAGKLIVYVISGNSITQHSSVDVVVGSDVEIVTYALDSVFSVPQEGQIYVKFDGFSDDSDDFEFFYENSSYLCVNQDIALGATSVGVIDCFSALQAIGRQIAPELSFRLETKLEGWITNGLQLRGVKSAKLKLSFGQLWDDLNRIKPLILTKTSENEISVKSRQEYLKSLGDGIIMHDISRYEFRPAIDAIFGRVRAGYDKWQSGTPTGNEEVLGTEDYATGLKKTDNTLDLVCKTLCGSTKLMEVVRRKQYEVGGSNIGADNDNDERIFYKDNNGTPGPFDMLQNWSWLLSSSSKKATKTSGTPDNTYRELVLNNAVFTGRYCILQGILTRKDWVATGDVVSFYAKNKKVRVLAMSSSFRPGSAGSGSEDNTIIEGFELKN